MTVHYSNNIAYLTSDLLESFNLNHGFFMRHGGCSPKPWRSLNMATSVGDSRENVIENRSRIAFSMNINRSSYYDLWQVHSNKVVIADQPRPINKAHLKADAIVTNRKGVSLLMLFADCVPLLLFDPNQNVIALAHAGWKGTLNGVSSETVKVMTEKFHCIPENIIGVVGPSICVHHYQIRYDVASKVKTIFNDKENVLVYHDNEISMDLPYANKLILERCGLKTIEMTNICTECNTDDWFSHRGENKKTGRFAAVVSL